MCHLKFRPLRRTAAGNSDLFKGGALLRLVGRSGINDIWAYCDLRQCAASNSDLFKGWNVAKVSGTVGNKRYSGLLRFAAMCRLKFRPLRRVAADYSDLFKGRCVAKISRTVGNKRYSGLLRFAAMCRLKFRLYKHQKYIKACKTADL